MALASTRTKIFFSLQWILMLVPPFLCYWKVSSKNFNMPSPWYCLSLLKMIFFSYVQKVLKIFLKIKRLFMWVSLWLCQREEKEEVFSFRRKEGFEFSHSPEHTFTSGVIYCLNDETFWASPHMLHCLSFFTKIRILCAPYSLKNTVLLHT